MAIFPGAVATDSDLYIAVNNLSTLLTDNPLTVGATTVNVISTTGFPTVGFISIDAEIIKYTGITATSFTGCTRGADGTTAASHLLNAQVDHNVIAAHHNVNKDEIKAIEQNISDRLGLSSTQILAPLGTASLPSITFAGDADTGLYWITANAIGLSVGGGTRVEFYTTSMTMNVPIFAINGTAATPAYTFTLDPDTGMYRVGANILGLATNGLVQWVVQSTGALVGQQTGSVVLTEPASATAPAYSFTADSDTGMYNSSANQLDFATAGTQRFAIAASGLITSLGKHEFTDGTVSLPGIAFSGDPDTGLYRPGGNRLAFVTTGIERWEVTSSGDLSVFNGTERLIISDGSAALPSIQFANDPDTGIYRISNDYLGLSAGGTIRIGISTTFLDIGSTIRIANTDGTTAAPSYTFGNDTDMGFYRRDANSTAYSNASREAVIFTGAGQGGQNSVGAFNINTGTPSTANTARLTAQTGTGDGDAFVSLTANGSSWHMGIDVSDSNVVSFGTSGTVGNNQIMRASATIGVQHLGTTTNDNAPTGYVGEYIESKSAGNTNFPATDVYGDATSISLTAGDWDITVQLRSIRNGATWSSNLAGISVTSGNSATGLNNGDSVLRNDWSNSSTTPDQDSITVVNYRVSLNATTTHYFKVKAIYTAGTPQYSYRMSARRIR